MPITRPDVGEEPEDHKAQPFLGGSLSSGSGPLLRVDERLRKGAEVTIGAIDSCTLGDPKKKMCGDVSCCYCPKLSVAAILD